MPAKDKPEAEVNAAYTARTAAIQAAAKQFREALVASGVYADLANSSVVLVESGLIALTEIAAAQMHLTGIAYSEEQRIREAMAQAEAEKVNPGRSFIGKPR